MNRVFTQTFVVVGAIIEREGKILLVRESKGIDAGLWNQPAGWVEPGEDPLQAVIREVQEETGIKFTPNGILGVYSLVRQDVAHKVDAGTPHGFKIIYRGIIIAAADVLADDISEINWFTPEEIQAMDTKTLRDIDIKQEIADYFNGVAYPLELIHHTLQK